MIRNWFEKMIGFGRFKFLDEEIIPMRFLLEIGSVARKFFTRSTRRWLAVFLLLALVTETALSVLAYRAAEDHLRRHDPRQLQNVSEVSFYFAPLELQVGTKISKDGLVEYLRELGYEDRPDMAPASYSVSGGALTVTPRST